MSSWHKEGLLSVSRRHFDFGNHFLSARHLVPAGWEMLWFSCLAARTGVCQAGQSLCWGPDQAGDIYQSLSAALYLPLPPDQSSPALHMCACKEPCVDAQGGSGFQGTCICSVTHGYSSTHPNLHPCQGMLQMPSASGSRHPSQENQDVGWKELVHCSVSPSWAIAQLKHTPRPREKRCCVLQFRHKKWNPIPSSGF